MSERYDQMLDDYVWGNLDDAAAAEFEAHMAKSSAFAAKVVDAMEAWAGLSLALPEVAPTDSVRDRLFASLDATSRFEAFVSKVAQLIDVTRDVARSLLNGIDSATRWEPGFTPDMRLYHLEAGSNLDNAIVGFVELKAGASFPPHTHLGIEHVMPVQGRLVDEDGTIYGPGDVATKQAGTSHYFDVPADGPDLIYLAIVFEGVQIGDMVLKAGDPNI